MSAIHNEDKRIYLPPAEKRRVEAILDRIEESLLSESPERKFIINIGALPVASATEAYPVSEPVA